jgi:hypothetical protein
MPTPVLQHRRAIRCPLFETFGGCVAWQREMLAGQKRPAVSQADIDPEATVATDRFGEIYFAAAISASTAAGNPAGNGTPDAA